MAQATRKRLEGAASQAAGPTTGPPCRPEPWQQKFATSGAKKMVGRPDPAPGRQDGTLQASTSSQDPLHLHRPSSNIKERQMGEGSETHACQDGSKTPVRRCISVNNEWALWEEAERATATAIRCSSPSHHQVHCEGSEAETACEIAQPQKVKVDIALQKLLNFCH